MPCPTDDRRDLLTIIAFMKAAPGKEVELKAEREALIESISQEDGLVNYDLHQGMDDPSTFFFYENWESAAHLETPHLVRFAGMIRDLLDENGLTMLRLQRMA